MSEMPQSLNAALALLQCQLPDIKKSETAHVKTDKANYTYTYADLAQITRELMPLLGGFGLSFIAKPTLNGEGKFVLAYKLLHISGEHEDGEYPLPTSGTPQAIGSAITYARRYTLVAVTGIAPEDDDDGAAAEAERAGRGGTAQRAAPARRQAPRPPAPEATDRPTAQRTQRTAQGPPLPGEVDKMTPKQQSMMMALFSKVDMTERADRLQYVNEVLADAVNPERVVASASELTKREAGFVIDKLQSFADQLDPPVHDAVVSP